MRTLVGTVGQSVLATDTGDRRERCGPTQKLPREFSEVSSIVRVPD